MSKKSDVNDIEDRLSGDRAALGETLAEILARVGPAFALEYGVAHLRDNADVYVRRAGQTVMKNPLAFALMGAGLAWLVLGNRDPAASDTARRKLHEAAEDLSDEVDAVADRWAKRLDKLRRSASEQISRIEAEAAKGLEDARDFTTEKASVLAEFAEGVKSELAGGLADLSAEARRKTIAAREAAYAARLNAEAAAKAAGQQTARFVQDHPLVTAALGIGLGVAIAAAVRSRPEKPVPGGDLGQKLADILSGEAEAALRKLGTRH